MTDSAAQTVSGQSIAAGTGVDHGCIIEVSLIDQDDSILGKILKSRLKIKNIRYAVGRTDNEAEKS